MNYLGSQCSLKLAPPKKFPKKSKKIYKDFFLRELKNVCHIYWLQDRLYLVSVPKPVDAKQWIEKNIELIYSRKWLETDIYKRTDSLFD